MDITDILVHVHSELAQAEQTLIEAALASQAGVISSHFSAKHPHELIVAYDPQATGSGHLLGIVRQWDAAAVMAGL